MGVNRAVGDYGERVAARYLEAAGLRVLDRNWRCRHGEIDLVVEDGHVLVVVEVKTRRGLDFGPPAEAVTRAKAQRLRGLAWQWLAEHRRRYAEIRFDVVSVVPATRGAAAVEHIRDAF